MADDDLVQASLWDYLAPEPVQPGTHGDSGDWLGWLLLDRPNADGTAVQRYWTRIGPYSQGEIVQRLQRLGGYPDVQARFLTREGEHPSVVYADHPAVKRCGVRVEEVIQ
mgnify:CR=1 FL=1